MCHCCLRLCRENFFSFPSSPFLWQFGGEQSIFEHDWQFEFDGVNYST